MKKLITCLALGLATTLSLAQTATGEVRKIDKAAGKVTIKHGGIRQLDMPPMTMVFKAEPPSLLDRVAVGDRVTFKAQKVGSTYTVTDLAPAR
jgi:Cu(I)/Ag(I) efflux system protein CusF